MPFSDGSSAAFFPERYVIVVAGLVVAIVMWDGVTALSLSVGQILLRSDVLDVGMRP